MATITLNISAGAQSATLTKTISGADLGRLITAYRNVLQIPAATDLQVLAVWAQNFFDHTIATVRSVEQTTAVNSTIATQTNITLS